MAFSHFPYSGVEQGVTLKEYLPEDMLEILHPFWHKFPPVHPLLTSMLGFLYVIMGFTSIGGNVLVLYIFMRYPKLRTPSNMLVMNLAFCDLMIMATLVPESMVSLFAGGIWIFGDLTCQIHAFCGSIFGYGQITTLVFISYDRYNVVVKGITGTPLTFNRVAVMLGFIWVYATAWAISPFFGYGSYALDGIGVSCSFGYMDQSPGNVAYIVGIASCMFFGSLGCIVYFYTYIVKAVFMHEKSMREQAKKMNVASLKSNPDLAQQSTEIKIAKVAMLNITLWLTAWTPFLIICLLGVLTDQKGLTPVATSLPVLFAKSSSIYNPIIYTLSHPRYREYLKKTFPNFCISVREETASTATRVSSINKSVEA